MRHATTKILGWLAAAVLSAAAMLLLALGLVACAASESSQTDTQPVTSSTVAEEPAAPSSTDDGDHGHSHDHDHSHTDESDKLPLVSQPSELPADQQATLTSILENASGNPEPDIRIVVVDDKVVQGKSRYEVSLGEDVVIEVFSDKFEQEVHLHGYDLTAYAGPMGAARFEFTADLPGVWEAEFEATGQHIFELAVS